jgi:hypothetical protein
VGAKSVNLTIKNLAETQLLKRMLYTHLSAVTQLEEHARSRGEIYTHPDRKTLDGLLTEIESADLEDRE